MSRRSGRRTPTAAEMVHPLVKPHVQAGYEESGGAVLSAPAPHVAFGYDQAMRYQRDLETAERMAAAESAAAVAPAASVQADAYAGQSAYGEYANNVGPQLQTRQMERAYRRDGRDVGAGYLNNPFEEEGREQIGRQFWQAPLGGHVRGALEGQEIFGHTIDRGQARMVEQGLAGLTAVGIGVPAFMAAVQQLSTPQDQNTIPF